MPRCFFAIPFLFASALLAVGCSSRGYHGQIYPAGKGPEVSGEVLGAKILGRIDAKGSSSTMSPSVMFIGAQDYLVGKAENDAIGRAIYGNDDVDMVYSVKRMEEYSNYLGLIGTANVVIKGYAVQLTDSKGNRLPQNQIPTK